MKIDEQKLRALTARRGSLFSPDELRREGNVFFVGGNLPELETLETLFDSHYQSHASLFHLTFSADDFANGENLARVIKKNFNVHLLARMDFAPSSQLIKRAYAAGVDILDIPLSVRDQQGRLRALDTACTIFPRWSVASTLVAGEGKSSASVAAGIDRLLQAAIVPLLTVSSKAALLPTTEVTTLLTHLKKGWLFNKVVIKPLLPLIYATTPLVQSAPRGVVRGLIDIIDDRRLLATSDLRRLLRVKEVEDSYASSGL